MSPTLEVSELPQAGPTLQRILREQQTLLDSAGVGIVFIRQRQIVRCNQRFVDIFGHESAEEAMGQSSQSLHATTEAFRELGRNAYPVPVVQEKQALFDHAMVDIAFISQQRMTRCNQHFEQMLGYGPGELGNTATRQWHFSDADWEDANQRCYTPLTDGKIFVGEMTLRAKDGRAVVCEVRVKAIDPLRGQRQLS